MKEKKKSKLYEWQTRAKKGGICSTCNKNVDTLSVDHIIPISLLDLLDLSRIAKYEDEENFQLMCAPCNHFKGHRIDIKNPKTAQLLYKYIKPYLKLE